MCKNIIFTVLSACFMLIAGMSPATAQNTPCPPDQMLEQWLAANKYNEAAHYLTGKIPASGESRQEPCDIYYLTQAAHIENRMGRNANAKWMILEALQRAQQLSDSTALMEANAIYAHILNGSSELQKAVKTIQPVLQYAYRHKNQRLEHSCLNLLGGIELQNGRFSDAKNYYIQSLRIAQELPYPEYECYDEVQIAYVEITSGNLKQGAELLDNSIQKATVKQDSFALTVATLIKATIFREQKNTIEWKQQIQKVIELSSAMRHEPLLSAAYSLLLEYYITKKEYQTALEYGAQAVSTIQKHPMPLFGAYLDSLMYTVYKLTGNNQKALESFESFHRNKERILNEEQLGLLREQKSQFELKEKNLIIENQQLQLSNARKEKVLLILLNGIFVLVIMLGALIRWFRIRSKKRSYQKEKMMASILEEERNISKLHGQQIESIQIPAENDGTSGHPIEPLTEERKDLYQEMLKLIETQKLYLNPHLDQKLLITLLGTNRAYLYQAISQNAEANFKNIINLYRVREVKRLIEKTVDERKSDLPEQLYTEAGFNSLATYHRIFKQFTGLTPREYMQEYARDIRQ